MRDNSRIVFLAIIASAFLLSSCLQEVGSGSGSATIDSDNAQEQANDPSLQQFSNTLHPVISQHCSTCHGDFQAPLFAWANDAQRAHDSVLSLNLANLSSPASSRLVSKVASNHHCWSGDCAADSRAIQNQIAVWAGAESEAEEEAPQARINSRFFTVPADLATCDNLSNATQFAFALAITDARVPSGTIMGFEVCEIDPATYQIFNLKVKSRETISIKGVHVIMNGVEFIGGGNDWDVYEGTVTGHGGEEAVPATIVKSNFFFVTKGFGLEDPSTGGPGIDTLRLQIEEITLVP